MLELAKAQTSVSHDHPDAIAAAQAVALAIFLARHGMPRDSLHRNLTYGYDLTPERVMVVGRFDISAAGTVKPPLATALQSEDWESAVRAVIYLGGYRHAACITGAIAEAIHG